MTEIFDASKQNKNAPHSDDHSSTHSQKKKDRHVDEYSAVMRNETPSANPLHAYAPKPLNVGFAAQAHNEKVILLLRQHPITQLKKVALILVLLLFLPFLFSTAVTNFLPERFHFAFTLGWYLLLLGIILESFLTWFFNVYIITDERIIDVDFLSMIYKNISSAKLDNIEDVTFTTGGVLASIVDYGTITIQTAAEKREFEFEDVPHPSRVAALLNELLLEEEREKIEGRVS